MNTYSDEYVEAIVNKWTKMLPVTTNAEFRSNVALALENQYNYHKTLGVSFELNKKLAYVSFKILPIYFQLMQAFSFFYKYYSVYSEDELIRIQNKNWSPGLEPDQTFLANVGTDFESVDYNHLAYELFDRVKEIILEKTVKCITRVYQKNNVKLERKLQFVCAKLKSENCYPDVIITDAKRKNNTGRHLPFEIGNNLVLKIYKTLNKATKNKTIIANYSDITYYSHVPIIYDSDDLRKLETNTLMNKFIKINTDGFVQIGYNPSLALIEE